MSKTLEEYTPQEIAEEATRLNTLYGAEGGLTEYFTWLGGLREECFERRATTMDPDKALAAWAAQMAARHGPRVRVFRGAYSWPAALGVVRYGEDPSHWPPAFSEDDIVRAKRWLYQADTPEGVTYITVEG